jgi:hypothetical protein
MPRTLRLIYFLLICSTAIFFVAKPSFGVTPPKTKCNIRIDDPHISKSLFLKEGIKAVKVNARSKCDRPMYDLVLTVKIYKVGLYRDYLLAQKDRSAIGIVYPNQIIRNNDTYVLCKNDRSSSYYGKASATALVDGKRVRTLEVITEKTVRLNCGT